MKRNKRKTLAELTFDSTPPPPKRQERIGQKTYAESVIVMVHTVVDDVDGLFKNPDITVIQVDVRVRR